MPTGGRSLLRISKAATDGLRALNTSVTSRPSTATEDLLTVIAELKSDKRPRRNLQRASLRQDVSRAEFKLAFASRKGKGRAIESEDGQSSARVSQGCSSGKGGQQHHQSELAGQEKGSVRISGRREVRGSAQTQTTRRRGVRPPQAEWKEGLPGSSEQTQSHLQPRLQHTPQHYRTPVSPLLRWLRSHPDLSESQLAMLSYLDGLRNSPMLTAQDAAEKYAAACKSGCVELPMELTSGASLRTSLPVSPSVESWAALLKFIFRKGDRKTLIRESRFAVDWELQHVRDEPASPSTAQHSWLATLSKQLLLSLAANKSDWADIVPIQTKQIQQVQTAMSQGAHLHVSHRKRLAEAEAHAWYAPLTARTRTWALMPRIPVSDSPARSQEQQHWELPGSARYPRTHINGTQLRNHVEALQGRTDAGTSLLAASNGMAARLIKSSKGHASSNRFVSDVIKAARLRSTSLRAEQTGRSHIKRQLTKTLKKLPAEAGQATTAAHANARPSALTLMRTGAALPTWLLLSTLRSCASAGQVLETERLAQHYLISLVVKSKQPIEALPNPSYVFPISRPDVPPPGAHLLNAVLRAQRIAYAAYHSGSTGVQSDKPTMIDPEGTPLANAVQLQTSSLNTIVQFCGAQGLELKRLFSPPLDNVNDPPGTSALTPMPRLIPNEQTIVHLLSSLFDLDAFKRIEYGIVLVRHAMRIWGPAPEQIAHGSLRNLHLGIRPIRLLLSWAERSGDTDALQAVLALHREWRAEAGKLGRPRPGMDGLNRGREWAVWIRVVRRVKRSGMIDAQTAKRLAERGGFEKQERKEQQRSTEEVEGSEL